MYPRHRSDALGTPTLRDLVLRCYPSLPSPVFANSFLRASAGSVLGRGSCGSLTLYRSQPHRACGSLRSASGRFTDADTEIEYINMRYGRTYGSFNTQNRVVFTYRYGITAKNCTRLPPRACPVGSCWLLRNVLVDVLVRSTKLRRCRLMLCVDCIVMLHSLL